MKHVSIKTNSIYDSRLEELGIKTVAAVDAGMYGNRHVLYIYDNKLWIGSGYESFTPGSKNQYHYNTQSNYLLLGDVTGYTDKELYDVNFRMVTSLPMATRELLTGGWLFPATAEELKDYRIEFYRENKKEVYND
tara:strand:- start:13105 stop:13509 length:405 start_codon:yes stop_codon:yes gene_type:complete